MGSDGMGLKHKCHWLSRAVLVQLGPKSSLYTLVTGINAQTSAALSGPVSSLDIELMESLLWDF